MDEPSSPSERVTLCVVTPCYNEEEVLLIFYAELSKVLDELEDVDWTLLCVDDGSSDGTLEILRDLHRRDGRVRYASLSRNFGHQIALTAGLDLADADLVVMMDSDLQHPPELIPEMLAKHREGYEVVSTVRESTEGESAFKNFSSRAFYSLINRLSDTEIVPGVADFCLLSRKAHQALRSMPERHRFLRGLISWIGFRRAFLPYRAARRAAGRSKYDLARMLRLALDAVLAFSVTPIRLAVRVGLAITALGVVYLTYVVGGYFLGADLVRGWGSLISVMLILGGLQIVFLGLIGEYVARIFEQVKGRPVYLLQEVDSSSD